MSVQEQQAGTESFERWFEHDLERRLALLEDPEYRKTAESFQPILTRAWWLIFALAIPIPLLIALVSFFTW